MTESEHHEPERLEPENILAGAQFRATVRGALEHMPRILQEMDDMLAAAPVRPASYEQFKKDALESIDHIQTMKDSQTLALDDPHVVAIRRHETTIGTSANAVYAELTAKASEYGMEAYQQLSGKLHLLTDFVYTVAKSINILHELQSSERGGARLH